MNNNLSLIGYRMPAEWELQESVWIAWPYNKNDWPGLFKNIPKVVAQIISELSRSQKINLLINNHKDCLLYTSPSPRDRTRSRMPSSA